MSKTVIRYNGNSTILCPSCFYGSICQFTTSYYSISLETCLTTSFQSRPIIVCIIIVLLIGTIGNILSIATFCHVSHGRGNRIYRLWIAIVGQLGTMIFTLRLLLMFVRQSSGIIECFVLDYLLSVLLALYHSLTACVFIEQVVVAYKNLSFSKENSQHMATIVIPLLILYHLLISLYKPFHRQLLADSYLSTRFWCVLHLHTGFLSSFERIANIVHFVLPFVLNFCTPILLLIILTKHRILAKANTRIWLNFKHVLCTYKTNVIVPYVLVILSTPYLVVAFCLHCITQPWQNTIYLIAYCLYLLPLMTSCFIFVLPSPTFRDELCKMCQHSISYTTLRRY